MSRPLVQQIVDRVLSTLDAYASLPWDDAAAERHARETLERRLDAHLHRHLAATLVACALGSIADSVTLDWHSPAAKAIARGVLAQQVEQLIDADRR